MKYFCRHSVPYALCYVCKAEWKKEIADEAEERKKELADEAEAARRIHGANAHIGVLLAQLLTNAHSL
jgi:hypothetical protein